MMHGVQPYFYVTPVGANDNVRHLGPGELDHPLDADAIAAYATASQETGGLVPIDHHDDAWRAAYLVEVYSVGANGSWQPQRIGEAIWSRSGRVYLRNVIPADEVPRSADPRDTQLDLPAVLWELSQTLLLTDAHLARWFQGPFGVVREDSVDAVRLVFSGTADVGELRIKYLRSALALGRALMEVFPNPMARGRWLERGEPGWTPGDTRMEILLQGDQGLQAVARCVPSSLGHNIEH